MANVVQNGGGKRFCPGWRRDLVLLLENTTGDISSYLFTNHPQRDHPVPKPTSQRVRLSRSPCGHPQAAWQVPSTAEMLRALTAPNLPEQDPGGDAGAEHHLTLIGQPKHLASI